MDERHSNGRRSTDSLVAKISAGALIAGLVWSVAAWGVPLVGLPKRVEILEQTQPALLYMVCSEFSKSHPQNEVPAVCAVAVRNGK